MNLEFRSALRDLGCTYMYLREYNGPLAQTVGNGKVFMVQNDS